MKCYWSPLGSYLATVHKQGAVVWGGASSFNQLRRYVHPHVLMIMVFLFPVISQLIDFSPGEKYLANCSSHEPSNPRDTHVRTPFFYPFFRDYYNIYSLTTV
ncbi:putative eukaryotic translation initiation factor 3 subunit B [Helianthus anomalus]